MRKPPAKNVSLSRSFSSCPIRTWSDISSPVISRPTPDSPDCAGRCFGQIELIPSARAATLIACWLAACCTALLFGVALPLPLRIGLCIAAATCGLTGIGSTFLLSGGRSVRSLEWRDGSLVASLGPDRLAREVTVIAGSFDLGQLGLLLWLKSCDGIHSVFIDAGKQEVCAIRRLYRRLKWVPAGARDSRNRQADTIRSQGLKCVTRH
jgi:hypothetical protein